MALIKVSEAPKKQATPLPKSIEDVINAHLSHGIRSWEMDENWEFYEDDIIDNAEADGWACKITKKVSPHDPEVQMKFIKFTAKG
jgi:hypothetical protein